MADGDDDAETLKKYKPDIPINEETEIWDDGTPDGILKGGHVTSKVPTHEEAFFNSDIDEEQKKRIYPSPTYCTVEYVWETLGMYDQRLQRRKLPDDVGVQSIDFINMNILGNEERIDKMTFQSWRPQRIKDEIVNMRSYWKDGGAGWGFRTEMMAQGGNLIQLKNRNILPFDPDQGDELWHRQLGGGWQDWTNRVSRGYDDKDNKWVWFDYDKGIMKVSTMLGSRGADFRITYRCGKGEVPWSIQRACGLMTALQVMQADWYITKLGTGGDLGSNVRDRMEAMRKEMNDILMMQQRPTIARPTYG